MICRETESRDAMNGDERLRRVLERLAGRNEHKPVSRPEPDTAWGWAVEDRLGRLEAQQRWLLYLMAGTLLTALLQLVLRAAGAMP